jgi:hypothetical protein
MNGYGDFLGDTQNFNFNKPNMVIKAQHEAD